nr:SIR2 family protein [uncultured Flavobacterium sp.]
MTTRLIIPEKLEEAIRNNNLVFFVGAGCSIPLKFPSWKKLIEDILEELNGKYVTSDTHFQNILTGVQSGNKSLFDALNLIENDAKQGNVYKTKSKEIVNSVIENVSENLPDESEVHRLLWGISTKIITTNYDKALEKYVPKSISPKIFDNKNPYQVLKSQLSNAQFLHKIHGDYENPDSIILFESDYKKIYEKDDCNKDALIAHFKGKTILFIGFSLTDPFVNDLFTNIKKIYKGHTVNEHYIFTIKNEDFAEFDITSIPIENWNESLLEYLIELEKIKSASSQVANKLSVVIEESMMDELTNNDIGSIVKLIEAKTKELTNDLGNKDLLQQVNDLRGKINKLMFGEIDYLQEVDKPFRNTDLQSLFDVIYSSEKLDRLTLERIQKVRTKTEIYKWFDRSVIVSAITCSLIHFNKADEQKITLLIDFINDNEEKVWQKAITSLFMVLNHLGNKWLRFDSIKTKIKSLNQNLRIQDACSVIIQLFSVGLNNVSMVNEELFINPYFNDKPFNYFLPYHQEENPAFDLLYDNYEGNNIDDLITALNQAPIPDQLKYLYCSKSVKDEKSNTKENKKISDKIHKILYLNYHFYPYSMFVQEIISFYRYFPVYRHEEKLKSQLKLTETPLRDYLLNEKQRYIALGAHFMKENNWAQAITNYKGALKLDENNIVYLLRLANCYEKNKQYEDEYLLRIKIKNLEANNEDNLYGIFCLYYNKRKDYKNSLEVANQLIAINDKDSEYFYFRAISYSKLRIYEKAILDLNEAIALDSKSNSENYFYQRARVLYELKEYIKANEDLDIVISINKDDYSYVIDKATNYMFLSLFEDAFSAIEKLKSMNVKQDDLCHIYANYYRLTKDFEKAFEYIEKAKKLSKDFRLTGTKATIYASSGDDNRFYEYLEKAFEEGGEAYMLFPDIKEKYKNERRFIELLKKYNQELF